MARQQVKKFRKSAPSNHQLNWLWGRESVFETLSAGRWRVYELFVTAELFEQNTDLLKSKQKDGVELEVVSSAKLEELVQTPEHQGIVARVSKFPYQTLESLNATEPNSEVPSKDRVQPLLVIIDRIQDTFNFASVLRCCQSAGVQAVITGEFCQAQVTTQIARASAGAVNHFPIIQAPDLIAAATKVRELGFKLIAVGSQASQVVCDAELGVPIALVVGGDQHAMDSALLQLCEQVSIPMPGQKTSLNSAVSAGILLYEIRRQQRAV